MKNLILLFVLMLSWELKLARAAPIERSKAPKQKEKVFYVYPQNYNQTSTNVALQGDIPSHLMSHHTSPQLNFTDVDPMDQESQPSEVVETFIRDVPRSFKPPKTTKFTLSDAVRRLETSIRKNERLKLTLPEIKSNVQHANIVRTEDSDDENNEYDEDSEDFFGNVHRTRNRFVIEDLPQSEGKVKDVISNKIPGNENTTFIVVYEPVAMWSGRVKTGDFDTRNPLMPLPFIGPVPKSLPEDLKDFEYIPFDLPDP